MIILLWLVTSGAGLLVVLAPMLAFRDPDPADQRPGGRPL